ncbi:MAG: hypothetical protein R3D57_01150 [Hyphomicrobiaceae bacterium]
MSHVRCASGALSAVADPRHSNALVRAYFLVTGPADPEFVPRLAGCVAKLGVVPLRLHASSEAGDGSGLDCDLRVSNLRPEEAERLESMLRRVIGVRQVVSVVEPAA